MFASKATIGLGYKLSKHYHLKIFEAKLQQKMVFGDHASICNMMSWSSAEVKMLVTCCDRSEIQQVLQAKCAGFVTDILSSFLKKSKKTTVSRKCFCDTASGQEVAEQIRVFAAHAMDEDFVPKALRRSLEIAHYLMATKTVDVTCLRDAVAELEAYSADGNRTLCLIKEFFVGSGGGLLFSEASATLEGRQCEVENAENIMTCAVGQIK